MFQVNDVVRCVETGIPSMLVLGMQYRVTEVLGNGKYGQIIRLDCGVTTYSSKFEKV